MVVCVLVYETETLYTPGEKSLTHETIYSGQNAHMSSFPGDQFTPEVIELVHWPNHHIQKLDRSL